MKMTLLALVASLTLLSSSAVVSGAETSTPAGSAPLGNGIAQASDPAAGLGFDINEAGASAADNKAYFSSRSAEQQAQIRQRCEAVTTTGSVANSDTPMAGTTAKSIVPEKQESASAASAGARVMAFCDAINH